MANGSITASNRDKVLAELASVGATPRINAWTARPAGAGTVDLDIYQVGGRLVILQSTYDDKRDVVSFDLYRPVSDTNKMDDTLAAIRELAGSPPPFSQPALDQREHAAVLAGLRLLQERLQSDGEVGDAQEVLTDGGSFDGLDLDEIDELCERIN